MAERQTLGTVVKLVPGMSLSQTGVPDPSPGYRGSLDAPDGDTRACVLDTHTGDLDGAPGL